MKHSGIEAEPPAAAALCGEALPVMRQFAQDIHTWGEELGLVGPRELDRLWTRHLLNSALLAKKLPGGTLADIGSGAGFPGLVVAILRPDIHCTLIEPLGRRATWLTEEAARLGLTNVTVLNQRAEDVAGHMLVDSVTARAVSALTTLLPIAIPLLKAGGELLLMKGQRVDQEIRDAAKTMVRWNITTPRVEITGPEYETEETRIFRATVGK
ncbi:MAG: 16S rRNA (guanine(527)-N(7))-methyltransferase RsmG [Microbacteriaceae bacterium]